MIAFHLFQYGQAERGPRFLHHKLSRTRLVGAVAATVICVCLAPAQTENPETPIPPGPYRIAGTVVNAKLGSPLARARVTLADTKKRQSTQSMITADDGHFEFHVMAGKYSLAGAKRGFITAAYNEHDQYSTAIVTAADLDTESLVLRLQPNAVLGGRVLDEFQEPVRNAQITAYRDNHFQGVSRIERYRTAITDDQGRYEITPIQEGTYFVSAKASPWYAIHPLTNSENSAGQPVNVDPSLDVVYPLTYYGDSTETDGAIPIPIRGGDRLEADIHLTPVPSLHLMIHVPGDGPEGVGFTLQKPSLDGLEPVGHTTSQMVSPGLYEVTGVAAGRYTVQTFGSNRASESSEVDINGGDVDLSSRNQTGKVKVAVQVAGAATIPQELYIGLRNPKGKLESTPVDAKGEANFTDVAPAKYDLVAGSRTRAYSVVRVSSEAGTFPGHALNVPPAASLTISATLVGGSVTVEGFAKRDGKAVSGVMIVLVPKDPDANHDRFRRDQSDLDGSFSLQDVIPGSYTVIAIEDGWDLDWSRRAVIEHYLPRGQPVEVKDQSSAQMQLEHPVDVQAK